MTTTDDRIDRYGTDAARWADGLTAELFGPDDPGLSEHHDTVAAWFADAITAGAGDLGAEAELHADREVAAMGQMLIVLEGIDEESRRRALKWVGARLGFEMEVRG